MNQTSLRTTKQQRPLVLITFIIILILTTLIAGVFLGISYFPSFQHEQVNQTNTIRIFFMGNEITNEKAISKDGMMYLPFDFIKKYIDPTIVWDDQTKNIIITTNKDVYQLPLGKTEGLLNLNPYSFSYPALREDGIVYLPEKPINRYFNIEIKPIKHESVLLIHDLNKPILKGIVQKETKLRQNPTIFSPWYDKLAKNEAVSIMKEVNGWYWIEDDIGNIGYIDKDNIQITNIKMKTDEKQDIYPPWNPLGEPIVLSWEYATNKTINPEKIGNLEGLQVVSPTWFHLNKDKNGDIIVHNAADIRYVDWAHDRGYQVWGLFSNSSNIDLTHEMLSNSDSRMNVIKQILSYTDLYQLDGINVDFEYVYLKDKDLFVQFIRELTPLLHEKDRTVSLDVTFKSESERWSKFYDREQLGNVVDYIIVMAYDEHWSSSQIAGSVSSLPWVEKGITSILEEVPTDKVILGIPLYTRLWIEEKNDNGKVTVTSKAYSMEQTKNFIKENKATVQYDKKTKQHYVEVHKNSVTYKIWMEDDFSMEQRIKLMKKYHLAGVAAWRRGFESKDYWSDLSKYINKIH